MNSRKHNWRLTHSQNNHFIKSQRYSQYEVGTPKSTYNSGVTGTPNHRIAGPLLTSTPINYNLSTYMDSKSPGLSERVVQYSNESQECRATHQAKYKTPGVFPVVHLFKKNLPVRIVSPSKVTMQVTMQESAMHNNMENITSEEIGRMHHGDRETSIGTHSVLDALKEISRKRIHPEDQCLPSNSYKRNRRECYIDSMDIKNSDIASDNGTTKSSVHFSDIPWIVNDITASLTSSHTCPLQPMNCTPAIVPQTVQEKIAQSNAETQTEMMLQDINVASEKASGKSEPIKSVENNQEAPVDAEKSKFTDSANGKNKASASPVRFRSAPVFSEMSAETTKSKMAVLLSALTGKDAKLKVNNKTESESGSFKSKPVSIMSHHDKPKHNKHVTFDIPEKENVKESDDLVENGNGKDIASVISNGQSDIKVPPEIIPPLFNKTTEPTKQETIRNVIIDNRPTVDVSVRPVLFSTESSPLSTANSTTNNTEIHKAFVLPFAKEQRSESHVNRGHKTEPVPALPGGFKFDFQSSTPSKPNIALPAVEPVKPTFSFANSNTLSNVSPKPAPTYAVSATHTEIVSSKPFTGINFNFNNAPKMSSSTSVANTTNTQFKSVPQFNSSSSPFGTSTTATSSFAPSIFSAALNSNATVTAPSGGAQQSPFGGNAAPSSMVAGNFNTNPAFTKGAPKEAGFKFNLAVPATTTVPPLFNASTLASSGLVGLANSTFTAPASFNTTTSATTTNVFSFGGNVPKDPAISSPSAFAPPAPASIAPFNPTTVPSLFSKPTNEVQFGQTAPNSFGSSSIFGSNEPTAQKSVFGATGNSQNHNPFGGGVFGDSNFKGNAFEFNSAQKSAFGAVSAPQAEMLPVNPANPPSLPGNAYSGMFSMGAQPTNSFPSEAAFGNSAPAPNTVATSASLPFNSAAFGNPFPPAFNAPGTGMFSIGSGTSSNKARTQLKARRRT